MNDEILRQVQVSQRSRISDELGDSRRAFLFERTGYEILGSNQKKEKKRVQGILTFETDVRKSRLSG